MGKCTYTAIIALISIINYLVIVDLKILDCHLYPYINLYTGLVVVLLEF